jgi:hypothetical protein
MRVDGSGGFAVTPAGDAIWAWRSYAYDGVLWNLATGSKQRNIKVTGAPWLPAQVPVFDLLGLRKEVAKALAEGRPPPSVPSLGPTATLLNVDRSGRLWVSVNVPVRSGGVAPRGVPDCGPISAPKSTEWRSCSFVEVIDPHSGALIASQAMNGYVHHTIGTNLLFNRVTSSDGIVHLQVFMMSLKT